MNGNQGKSDGDMNKFTQHIPTFVDVESESFDFDTTEELLNNPVILRYKNNDFSHFALSGQMLMVICGDGSKWWVVGYLRDPSSIDLPEWIPPGR